MKVIAINGHPQAGKDLFVKLCQKHYCFCHNISTVDFVKQVAEFCGWDGTKTDINRKFLSDLKQLLAEWRDVPMEKTKSAIENYCGYLESLGYSPDKEIVFIHCREPREIARLVQELGAKTLYIRRRAVEEKGVWSNSSDANTDNYDYDYIIDNNGTVDELEVAAKQFLRDLTNSCID